MAGAMPKNRLRLLRFPALLVLPASALLATGCGGYTSEYLPPQDGRPRLVWADNKVVPMIANAVPGECTAEVDSLAGGGSSPRMSGYRGGGTYYVPVRTVVVVRGSGAIVPGPRLIFPGLVGGGSGIGKLGGGGGSDDLGKAAVFVAVVAILVLPFVALGLATGRPEPEKEVAQAIDRVNAQTDLARVEGSACDEMLVAGQEAQQ